MFLFVCLLAWLTGCPIGWLISFQLSSQPSRGRLFGERHPAPIFLACCLVDWEVGCLVELPPSFKVWAVVWREAAGYYHRGTTFSSPAHLAALDGIFNYTVTYRRDADISFTYFEKQSHSQYDSYSYPESHQCRWRKIEVWMSLQTYSLISLSILSFKFPLLHLSSCCCQGGHRSVSKESLSSKSDLVLWISSHCSTNSHREE